MISGLTTMTSPPSARDTGLITRVPEPVTRIFTPGTRIVGLLLCFVACMVLTAVYFERKQTEEQLNSEGSEIDSQTSPIDLHIKHWAQHASSREKRQATCANTWSDWSDDKCAPCGGCGFRYRTCPNDPNTAPDSEPCPAKRCIYGWYRRRESAISPKERYIQRAKRCCYNFRYQNPVFLARPRRCSVKKCQGWAPHPCTTSPCNSGTCTPLSATTYVCTCPSTATGEHCEFPIK